MKPASSAKLRIDRLSEKKVRLLGLMLKARAPSMPGMAPAPREVVEGYALMPVSAAQRRFWLIDRMEGGDAYHVQVAARLHGALNVSALQQAYAALVDRHEALRTVFIEVDGEPLQRIASRGDSSAFEVVEPGNVGPDAREVELNSFIHREARRAFDLSAGPLCRARLVRLSVEQHVLLLTIHHIIIDAWSVGIVLRELRELYAARCEARREDLAPLAIQYADYAHWQRCWLQSELAKQQLGYWRSHLAGAAGELNLPTDRARPVVQSYRGDNIKIRLGAELSAAIKAMAAKHELTLFMMLYAAWAALLARLSGQTDVVIGTPVANRSQPELAALIGLFINTLVLRAEVVSAVPLEAFLQQVKKVTLEAYDNQDIPFEEVVQALHPARTLSRNPLFNVMLVVQDALTRDSWFAGLDAHPEPLAPQSAKFDLLLSLEECGDEIRGVVDYAVDLYDRETIQNWIDSFMELLHGLTNESCTVVGDLPVLTHHDLRLLRTFNTTAESYSQERLVHQLFEQQARAIPTEPAVLHGQRVMTYAQLNERASALGDQLRALGVRPDSLVGVFVERGVEMVIGLLGILKAGGAYLPLDPSYPRVRLEYMLSDAAPTVVLTQRRLRESLPVSAAQVIALDENLALGTDVNESMASVMSHEMTSLHLAYVIYTSGSTGRPKGTAMPHRPLVNLIEWQRRELGDSACPRVLQFAALSFDVAFQEIFTTLGTGGTLVLIDEWMRRDVQALVEAINLHRVERLFVPPMMLQALAEHVMNSDALPRSLRDVITAGEQLRISGEIVRMFQRLGGCRLHNHYGPTETHVATALTLDRDPLRWPTLPAIGRPIANAQIHVLNAAGQEQPVGVRGEIYIGGDALARGYVGRPELTAERFVRRAVNSAPQLVYRTGDIGVWERAGVVKYQGRNDDQVKIRGFRIELAEIEAQLACHPQVGEVAVLARDVAIGDKRLIAYVVPRHLAVLNAATLREHLAAALPDYMVPATFITLTRLPMTPSGKLDRSALPAPSPDASLDAASEPPQGDTEAVIARTWQELLQIERVGRTDNFFALGGHSLLAVKALSRVNRLLGSSLKVTDFYKHPTVAQLAASVGGRGVEDALIDLSREAVLDDSIVVHSDLPQARGGALLLTGATGFVGRFLLAQLLADTNATIYCPLRASTRSEATHRLRAMLMKWDLWHGEAESRIIALPADLRQHRFGLDEQSFAVLSREVDTIYHCATSMNHLETYAMARSTNVDSAQQLLLLATQHRLKQINFISTLGIFRSQPGGTARTVREDTPIDLERHRSSQGYVASKWVGEKIFMLAQERGIPCNIVRLGLIWADTRLGRYDELQHDYRVIKSCLLSGYGIRNHRYITPPTPADFAARAVVFLAKRHADGGGVFHVSSPRVGLVDVFDRCNELAGTSLELLSMYQWVQQVKRLHEQGRSLPVLPLVEPAFALDEVTFEQQQQLIYCPDLSYDCSVTYRELLEGRIVAPVLDDELLIACLRDMCLRDNDVRHSPAGACIQASVERARNAQISATTSVRDSRS